MAETLERTEPAAQPIEPIVDMGEGAPSGEHGLRRAVGPWGSYSWGYADVGADMYVALGLVMAAAQGFSNVAFLIAGMIYVCVGLAYTELAPMYPMAGGGQLFVLRGLGDFWGFIAGWAVLLDFTIDIALFALFSAGYFDHFFPGLSRPPWIILEASGLVLFLLALNIIGVRESSKLNEVAAGLDIATETVLICIGFMFAFDPAFYWHQVDTFLMHFDLSKLLFGTSLAIISSCGAGVDRAGVSGDAAAVDHRAAHVNCAHPDHPGVRAGAQ